LKRKVLTITLVVILVSLLISGTALAKAFRGSAEDPLHSEFGWIEYLSNPAGYHFWFTMNADYGRYEEGHSYHNVYKVKVDDPSEWCGPIPVGGNPSRAPYNSVGHKGESVYYKIWDTTTDTLVCP
jgi:hypothetical protein